MSLNMFYRRLRDLETPVLLVVKDQEGFISELYLYSVIWNKIFVLIITITKFSNLTAYQLTV